jgi:hypothetical protein
MPNHDRTQYLRVMGRLRADRQLTLRLGYLTATPPWSDVDGESALRAEVFDDHGAPLGTFPLRLSAMCAEGRSGESRQAVRGFVPFHPSAKRVVFTYRGQPIKELSRSDVPPRASWSWRPSGHVAGRQTVTWTGDHPNGLPVEFFLRYSWDDGRSWHRLNGGTRELSYEIDFDQLPGGERCALALVVTDGINTTMVETPRFSLPRKGCVAIIVQPLDGTRYEVGHPVPLQGQGFWREENRVERDHLIWRTSSDGEPLLQGRSGQVLLPPGTHAITLLAGFGPNQGRAQVRVVVGELGPAHPPATGQ